MLNPKSYLGRGWSFPVRLHEKEGTIRLSEYEEDIRESIRIILSTSKGLLKDQDCRRSKAGGELLCNVW